MKKNLFVVVALTVLTIVTLQTLSSRVSRTSVMNYLNNRFLAQNFDDESEDVIDETPYAVFTTEAKPEKPDEKGKNTEVKKKPATDKKTEKSTEKQKSSTDKKQQEPKPLPKAPAPTPTSEQKQPAVTTQSVEPQKQTEPQKSPETKPVPSVTVFGLPSTYLSQVTTTTTTSTTLTPEQQPVAMPVPPPSFQSFDVDQVKISPQLKKWQEQYQLPPVPVDNSTITLGVRDSDGDGISDLEEGRLGTNPILLDSDNDGVSDADEALLLHTNPLNSNDPPRITKNGKSEINTAKLGIRITSFVNNQLVADNRPIIRGVAPNGMQIEMVAIRDDKSELSLGKTQSDENAIWILEPESIPDGEYTLKARKRRSAAFNVFDLFAAVLGVTQENSDSESFPVRVKVNASLDVTAPAPKKLADKSLEGDVLLKNVRIEIRDRKPTLLGRAAYGSEVLTTWRSLVMTSALIADTTAGEFSIQPQQEIDFGDHEVYIQAVRPKDGALSKTVKIAFRVDKSTLENAAVGPAPVKPVAERFLDMKKSAESPEGFKALMVQQNLILITIIGVVLSILLLVGVVVYVGHNRRQKQS